MNEGSVSDSGVGSCVASSPAPPAEGLREGIEKPPQNNNVVEKPPKLQRIPKLDTIVERPNNSDSVAPKPPNKRALVEITKPRKRIYINRKEEKVLMSAGQASSIERARALASEKYHKRQEAALRNIVQEELSKLSGETKSMRESIMNELNGPINNFLTSIQYASSEESEEEAPPPKKKKSPDNKQPKRKDQESDSSSGRAESQFSRFL